jgi:hypothetical protein
VLEFASLRVGVSVRVQIVSLLSRAGQKDESDEGQEEEHAQQEHPRLQHAHVLLRFFSAKGFLV